MPVPAAPASAQAKRPFDPNILPTIKARPGAFPCIGLPAGYSYHGTKTHDHERFMLGIDGKVVTLEGRFFAAALQIANNGENMSTVLRLSTNSLFFP